MWERKGRGRGRVEKRAGEVIGGGRGRGEGGKGEVRREGWEGKS